MSNTVKFTFNSEYCLHNDVIEYYCDVDDDEEEVLFNVYVENVDDILINNLTDDELCEFFGLEPEYLVYTNRQDLL